MEDAMDYNDYIEAMRKEEYPMLKGKEDLDISDLCCHPNAFQMPFTSTMQEPRLTAKASWNASLPT